MRGMNDVRVTTHRKRGATGHRCEAMPRIPRNQPAEVRAETGVRFHPHGRLLLVSKVADNGNSLIGEACSAKVRGDAEVVEAQFGWPAAAKRGDDPRGQGAHR